MQVEEARVRAVSPCRSRASTPSADTGLVSTRSDSEAEDASPNRAHLCLQYLVKKECRNGLACPDYHSESPYLWQILTDGIWENLEPNKAIERAFCRPQNHGYRLRSPTRDSLIGYLDFDTMRCSGQQSRRVRRLSVPSVDHWVWYSEDTYDEWVVFGEKNSWGINTELTSAEIEDVYIHHPRGILRYKDSRLDLAEMHQSTATWKRSIRRRPEFQARSQAASAMSSIATEGQIPLLFQVSYEPDYTTSVLNNSSPEYNMVAEHFHKTMFRKYFTIFSIKRVHNPGLWDIYQRKKEKMLRDIGKQNVNEQRLYHKSRPNAQNAICRKNLDMRYSRTSLQLGRGVYFSWNAHYCHKYFEKYRHPEGDRACMFLARVLVGISCSQAEMQSHYLHPPSKDGSLVNVYDSAVNDLRDPWVTAIFYSDQIYPEYIISYSNV